MRIRRASVALLSALALLPVSAVGQGRPGGDDTPRLTERDVYRAQAKTLSREVEDLRRQLVRLGGAQAVDEGAALRQRARLARLQKQELALKRDIGANRSRLTRLLGALQLYQRDPPPPLFVHTRSARDAARAAVLMKAVTPELERRGRALSARAESIRKVRREVAAASETLFLTDSELAERRGRIGALIAQKSRLERRLLRDADVADANARALADRASSLGELTQNLAAISRAPSRAAVRLLAPVQGRLIRRFGEKAGAGPAQGLTWRTGPSAQVLAPSDATVEYVGPLKGYGLIVILRSAQDQQVVLAGLDQAASGAGRTVAAGEPIGRMAPGAPELYLEVRRGGEPVDPARWLQAGSQPRRDGRS